MAFIGRKTLTSERARTRRIDMVFARLAQALLLMYAVFVFCAWLSYRPAFRIDQIVIEGFSGVDAQHIFQVTKEGLSTNFFKRIARDNMVLYPRGSVLEHLHALDPRVKNVAIVFDSKQKLHVALEEYVPSFLYCVRTTDESPPISVSSTSPAVFSLSEDCYFADEGGYIFAPAPKYNSYPFLTILASSSVEGMGISPIGTFAFLPEEFERIKAFFATLSTYDLSPRTIAIRGNGDYEITTQMPWSILWASAKDPEESINNLSLVLKTLAKEEAQESLRVVDLRFGNKVFYK